MYNPPSEKTGQFTPSRRQNAAAPACDGVPLGGAGRHRGGPFSPLDKCRHRTSSLRDWPDTGRQVTPQSWASGSGFWTPGPAALEKSGRGRAWPRAHRGEGKAGPGSSALRSGGTLLPLKLASPKGPCARYVLTGGSSLRLTGPLEKCGAFYPKI